MMRYKICLLLTMICFGAFAQDQQEKISNQLYYIQEAKAQLSYARNYADSSQVQTTIDSMDAMIDRLVSFLESIEVESPVAPPPAEQEMGEMEMDTTAPIDETYPEYNEEHEENGEMNGENDMGLANPIIDKFNPFKKMKSKLLIETGINNFFMSLSTTGAEPTVSPGSSWFWNFGIIKIVPLSNRLSIETGVTYLRNRFRFSNDVRLLAEGNGQIPAFVSVPNASEDPKLIAHYFTLPLNLHFKMSKSFHVTLGGFGGYNVGAGQKIQLKEKDEEIEEFRHGAYGLNKWIYGAKAGLGLGGFDIFCQVSFANFFESNQKYDYKTYMIGTSFKL